MPTVLVEQDLDRRQPSAAGVAGLGEQRACRDRVEIESLWWRVARQRPGWDERSGDTLTDTAYFADDALLVDRQRERTPQTRVLEWVVASVGEFVLAVEVVEICAEGREGMDVLARVSRQAESIATGSIPARSSHRCREALCQAATVFPCATGRADLVRTRAALEDVPSADG